MIYDFLFNHTPLLYLTQSLWRDEAYSVLLSHHSVIEIIKLTAQDFNPPLYYLILHFWMNLFGSSEIAIRMLSFIFHLALVYICYLFAKKLKFSRFAICYSQKSFAYLLFAIFLNPMLLYYGFEARMYSLLALLATASMYFFYCKKWKSYIIVSALGLWTQPFMVFVLLSQIVFSVLTKSLTRKLFLNFLAIFLLFSPWIPTLLSQFLRSSSSWIWPINWTTVTIILGSLFTGYEGTPDGLWVLMGIISLAIIFLAFYLLRHAKTEFIKLILCWLFLPVILVLIVSIFKPIYVNRYLIFVSVAEVFLIVAALFLIKNSSVRFLLFALYFILNICLLFTTVSFHQKQNIRQIMSEINYLAKPNDLILAQTPLTIFEAKYYSRDADQVFLYNPRMTTIPDYVGKNLIDEMKQTTNFPIYPKRAFLIHNDATYEMVYQK